MIRSYPPGKCRRVGKKLLVQKFFAFQALYSDSGAPSVQLLSLVFQSWRHRFYLNGRPVHRTNGGYFSSERIRFMSRLSFAISPVGHGTIPAARLRNASFPIINNQSNTHLSAPQLPAAPAAKNRILAANELQIGWPVSSIFIKSPFQRRYDL